MIQIILVSLIISAATFYLGREAYLRFFKKEAKCDGCAFNSEQQK